MGAPREREWKKIRRQRIKLRIRKRVVGTPDRPRLTVYRSLRHVYAQIIDDTRGYTLVAASSLEKDLREQKMSRREKAREVGRRVAERALQKGIQKVVFDRNGYKYHGCVQILADAAREAGLQF